MGGTEVLLVIIGIFIWPELTFAALLWYLGHPFLAIFAFLFTTFACSKTRKIVKTIIFNHKGKVIKEEEKEEED